MDTNTGINIFYIDTIEQVEAAADFPYTVNEYGKKEQWKDLTFEEVESKYFKKLSDVSNDLKSISSEKKHYYMYIAICDSTGGILEEKTVGVKQPVEKKPDPEPTPEEEG